MTAPLEAFTIAPVRVRAPRSHFLFLETTYLQKKYNPFPPPAQHIPDRHTPHALKPPLPHRVQRPRSMRESRNPQLQHPLPNEAKQNRTTMRPKPVMHV